MMVQFILFTLTVAERPQHMLMRVAVGIHMEDIDAAIEVNPLKCSFYILQVVSIGIYNYVVNARAMFCYAFLLLL